MKKSIMFKKAHEIAKRINNKVENYAIAFSIALKQVWKMVKSGRKRIPESTIKYTVYDLTHQEYTGPTYKCGVPDWILNKNFDQQECLAIWNYTFNEKIAKETEKAVLVEFITDFGNLSTWCPKSVFKGLTFNN